MQNGEVAVVVAESQVHMDSQAVLAQNRNLAPPIQASDIRRIIVIHGRALLTEVLADGIQVAVTALHIRQLQITLEAVIAMLALTALLMVRHRLVTVHLGLMAQIQTILAATSIAIVAMETITLLMAQAILLGHLAKSVGIQLKVM